MASASSTTIKLIFLAAGIAECIAMLPELLALSASDGFDNTMIKGLGSDGSLQAGLIQPADPGYQLWANLASGSCRLHAESTELSRDSVASIASSSAGLSKSLVLASVGAPDSLTDFKTRLFNPERMKMKGLDSSGSIQGGFTSTADYASLLIAPAAFRPGTDFFDQFSRSLEPALEQTTAGTTSAQETPTYVPLPLPRPAIGTVPGGSTASNETNFVQAPANAPFQPFVFLTKVFEAFQKPSPATGRNAVYDIQARTLYLPTGEKLEAHSGLGSRMDDARFVHEKSRGPTPPNIYHLSLREAPFHGVQALRLTPVGNANMYGRTGILAHPYMLGRTGASNGCVSVQDYGRLLQAYLDGKVDTLTVTPGDTAPSKENPEAVSNRNVTKEAALDRR